MGWRYYEVICILAYSRPSDDGCGALYRLKGGKIKATLASPRAYAGIKFMKALKRFLVLFSTRF